MVKLKKAKALEPSLGDLLDLTLKLRWGGSKSELKTYSSASKFVLYAGGREASVRCLTTPMVQDYTMHLRRDGLSAGAINRRLAAVSVMSTVAAERGWIEARPVTHREREAEHRTRYLTLEEQNNLFTHVAADDAHVFHLLRFLVETGLRLGEALALQPQDFSAGYTHVTVRNSKNSNPRTVPLTRDARNAINGAGLQLFCGITQSRVTATWNRAKAYAGLADDDGVVPHCLRHTCASRLVQAGVELPVIQRWLGHKSITMTMRYAHVSSKQTEAALAALEKFNGQQG